MPKLCPWLLARNHDDATCPECAELRVRDHGIRVLYLRTGTEHLTAVPNDNRTYCGRRLFPGRESWVEWDKARQVFWSPAKVCQACQKADQ